MILLISFLVIVHELGHFLAAKAFKMKVERFGIGLPVGPILYKKQTGDTEFVIHALLLGGYVSFPDDNQDSELPKDSPERFSNKPVYQRMIVIVAGVFANFVTALLLVMFAAGYWHKLPANMCETTFQKLLPSATQSTKNAGFVKDDIIYEVNGTVLTLPNTLSLFLYLSREFDGFTSQDSVDKKIAELKELNPNIDFIKPIDKGTVVNLPPFEDEKPITLTKDQVYGFGKYKSNEIELTETQKAVRDDIRGKTKYTIKIPMTISDLAYSLSDTRHPVSITVLRNDEKIQLPAIYPDRKGMIGIEKGITEVMYPVRNLSENLEYSLKYFKMNSDLMLYGLKKLFTGKVPMEEMHGIVAITKIGSDIIEHQGLFKGLLLTAIISLNLAYLNLLPIPALDGGHVIFLIIEKIMGRPLNEKTTEIIANIFFYLLILLMFFVIYNDIVALVTNKI